MTRVAVLGCGPAGLLAAHAAAQVFGRASVEVFSDRPRKSTLYGCQYLHAEIPGLDCGTPHPVAWEVWGDPADYQGKVYGDDVGQMTTSAQEYGWGKHTAWDIRRAYNQLWAEWGQRVHDMKVDNDVLQGVIRMAQPDVVLSTIPRPALCAGNGVGHSFISSEVWAIGDAPELGQYSPFRPPSFTVVCNAEKAPRWYRAAHVFDYVTCEWPFNPKPPLPGVAAVCKPLRSNCNCHTRLGVPVVPLGRYGAWQKGYLTHQAYGEALQVCTGVKDKGVQGAMF